MTVKAPHSAYIADRNHHLEWFHPSVTGVRHAMPEISFPRSVPTYCAASLTLSCPATVNGQPTLYSITAEALETHFGARSPREEDLVRAFTSHRQRIERIAEGLFELTQAREILLRSGHIRFAG